MSKGTRYLLAVLLSLVSAGGFGLRQAAAQTYVFNANVFGTGQSPQALVTADFNGDGLPDVAVANQSANTVSVLLGVVGGGFSAHTDYAVGANPISIVAADFNGDGKLDLAVVNSSNNSFSVLLGNGDGTFQNQAVTTVGTNPDSIAAGDLNGDGKVDLVVANFNDNTVSVMIGNGDGTFTAANGSPFPTGTGPSSVVIAQLNSDKYLDVATADKSINSISVLLGNGDGTLQAHTEYATGRNPSQIVAGDFNNDSITDLATANGGDNNITVLLNNGSGKFSTQSTANTYTTCTALAAADFNGDHNLDLAVTSSKSNSVVILLGKGNGQFQTEVPYASGGLGPVQVATADINGDGHPDLVIANSADNDISVLLNNAAGGFSSQFTASPASTDPISMAVADFNGDGILDVATLSLVYSSSATGTVSVLLGNGDGTLQSFVPYSTVTGHVPEFIAAGDFNGDGKPDLVVANNGESTVSVLLNQGDGTFPTTAPTYATGVGPTSVAIGDFNGDKKLDLAVANATAGTISILLGNGDGTFQTHVDYSAGVGTGKQQPNPSWIETADVNGDGALDLVVADKLSAIAPGLANTGIDDVSVLLGKGDGTFSTGVEYSTGTGTAPGAVTIADFNGDGMPDIASANTGNNTVSILLNIGNGAFGGYKSYPVGGPGAGIAAGSLRGDSTLDLVVGVTGTFTNMFSTLLGNGDGTFQSDVDHPTSFPQIPNRRQPVTIADMNGDGTLDVVAADEQSSVVDIYLNQPQIAFSPGTITFAGQLVGTTSSPAATITVANPGTAPLSLTSFVASGDFAVQTNTATPCPTGSASLGVGSTCTVTATFTPTTAGTRSGSLTVTDDVAGSPQALAFTGTGEAPTVTLKPTSLTFAAQNIGSTSTAQTVTLTNSGTGTLTINSIAASSQYAETNTCNGSVAQGASCTISVTFTPTAPGTQQGTITITDDASPTTQTIALTGTGNGPAASLSPATVTFSSQPVGSTSPTQKVTLTNTGNQSLSSIIVTINGPFGQTNTCGSSLAANASCTINVDFAPTASGAASGSLSVSDNAGGSPQKVTLSGTGSTGGYASLNPASRTFASTPIGQSSSQRTTLTNTGNAVLAITSIAVTGANASDFTETNTCGSSLNSGQACTITVTFTPTAAGNLSGAVTVTSNGAGSPQSVSLTGTGSSEPTVSLTPASYDFGSHLFGSSTTEAITLKNTGNAPLAVTSIAATGNGFSQTNSCGTSVNAGNSCVITVTFVPPAGSTSLTGTIVITDNAPNSPQTVQLSGSGTGPALTLAPTSLSFPGQALMSTSKAQTMTLTNGGTSALSITNVAVTGAAASQFAATSACGSPVAVGASCTISVTFTPTTQGNQSASLTITDTAANSPQNFSLSGGGADFSVAAATASQTVSAGQSGVYSVSLTPTGGFNATVTLSCSASIPAGTCTISQPSLTLNSVSTVSVTATTSAGAAAPVGPRLPSGPGPWLWIAVLGVIGLGSTLLVRRRRIGWVLASALVLVSVWAGCGGGSSNTTSTATSTPTGTYTIKVTASSGSLSNSASLTLVVH